ncbi:hypothetical protein Fmac_018117 [Flemingia macrophylla]|uniref:Non-specific lipid-transfer protein n=1 Tax=Flemingia macrophylla TaxID=520843 RepID=A0ABD1M434_9FABA
MPNSGVVKLVCLASLFLALVDSSRKAEAAVACGQVVSNLTPCISYVLNGGQTVPAPCCNGIRTLYNLAHSKPDRQKVCNCIKNAISAFPYTKSNVDLAAGLPKKCGVNIPYQISPTIDCTRVQREVN